MKKAVAIGICAAMFIIMAMTVILGYRSIGFNLLDYIHNVSAYQGVEKGDKLFENIQGSWDANVFLKSVGVDIFGLVQKMQGKDVVYDIGADKTVYKGSDGKLYFAGNPIGEDNTTALHTANQVAELSKFCEKQSIDFLFVGAPTKYNAQQVSLPIDTEDDRALNQEYFQRLNMLGVNSLNLMERWEAESECYSDGFFTTDHHWNIETAFWGFQQIVEKLNELGSTQIDEAYYASSSYTTEIIPDCFLGSMGVRTGGLYVGKDDIAVISPNYTTDFYMWRTASGHSTTFLEKEGTFEQAILTGSNAYGMYIAPDERCICVDNRLNDTGRKILLIKDSFAVPVAAWLACCSDELTVLDLRYDQEKTVCQYIEENDIDTVIVLYNPGLFATSRVFEFGLNQ